MPYYIIAVDIGTHGSKAALFDVSLNQVCSTFEISKLIQPQPGTVWQEADDLYGSVVRTISMLMEQSNVSPNSIAAIAVDSQMAGIMGIDRNGEASTYYDSWLDSRCGKYMDQMRKTAGKRVTEITGGPVTYTHGPKILWWKHEHPQAYQNTAKFVLPHGYVVGKMAGLTADEAYFDYTCLQYSGFGDNKNKVWSNELLEQFEVDKDKMARIADPSEIVGKTTKAFADLCGLIEGIPVIAGSGDTSASIFGSGMFESGMLLDCAGTASVLSSAVNEFVPDTTYETLTMMRSPIDGYWFPLAYINGGGLCLRWFRDEMTGNPPLSYAQLEEECKALPPGSEGLLFVPHFTGRVLPNNPHVRGSFSGLTFKHTRGHMFRSVMESIAYEYDYYLTVLKKLYPQEHFSNMYAAGGGAKSELFLSIKADVMGIGLTSFEMGDTALIGDATLAGMAVGLYEDYRKPITQVMREKQQFIPDMVAHKKYKPYAKTYLKLIDALTPIYQEDIFRY